MNASVSVVIPAYCSSATLGDALDSVAAQTRPVHEIVVVDDASPDNTPAVAEAWARTSGLSVRILRQSENRGPAAARNAAIRVASGSWMAFLDADDAWLPERLERQLDTAATHPEAVLLCGETLPLEPGCVPAPVPPAYRVRPLPIEEFMVGNPVATSTVLARRDAILDVGGFDERFRGPEDYDLWLRLAGQGPCLMMQAPLARYRARAGSLSMDDRTFMPQVLGVLEKAFSPGGSLYAHRQFRRRALAEQFTSASWMAHQRGDRIGALRWLLRSWLCGVTTRLRKEREAPLQRVKLLLRYLLK